MQSRLLLFCLLFVVPGSATAQNQAGAISIRVDGKPRVISRAELEKLPRREHAITAEGSDQAAKVSGVSLWDLLQLAGAPAAEASGRQRAVLYVTLTGADGQNAVVALVEFDPSFSKRVVLLADRRNGEPLSAAEGPWRVIIPDDIRHARWIRGLVSVEVQAVK